VAPGGYAWWYLDALSDDGRHAITLIAFIGSVFSPYYARARRRGSADPEQHVALNVALYGAPRRWTMTERGRASLQRTATSLRIGPSALRWERGVLCIDLAEVAAPWPARVRGRLRLEPQVGNDRPMLLSATGGHHWQPIAPRARVSVDLDSPALRWQGEGYLDTNWGAGPLEEAFTGWHWSRSALPDGGCQLHYDVKRRDGSAGRLHLCIDRDGRVEAREPLPLSQLPPSRWGLARQTQGPATLATTLEDGPFYARSILATPWRGQALHTVHESLSLQRFSSAWVQALLPFRMPRWNR
jgi:carotenoid 1,2-hydratase